MAYNSFPYTSMHELNLDYLLNKSKEVQSNVEAAAGSASAAAASAAAAAGSADASLTYSRNSANSATASEASAADSAESARIAVAAAGDPVTFTASSQLTDTSKIYVYVGETGTYTYGHWYYYANGSWIDGGVYGAWTTDNYLSLESTNAVQNKVITKAINNTQNSIDDITTKSNNIMPVSSYEAEYAGVASVYSEGVITFTGTATAPAGRALKRVILNLNPGTYTFSCGIVSGNGVTLQLMRDNDIYIGGFNYANPFTVTLDNESEVWVGLNQVNGTTYNTSMWIQCETGSQATSHVEPYVYANDAKAREDIEVLNDKIEAIESQLQKTGVQLVVSGNELLIKTMFYDEPMQLSVYVTQADTNNPCFDFGNYSGAFVKSCVDDICPVYYQGSYRCAGHGNNVVCQITAADHGLTVADIGKTVAGDGRNWVIIKIDGNYIWLISVPEAGTRPFSTALSNSGTLTGSGLTITYTAKTVVQLKPNNINRTYSIKIDDVPVSADGTYTGEKVTLTETYESIDCVAMVNYLMANVGNNTNDSYYSDSIGGELQYSVSYVFYENGSCTVAESIMPYKNSLDVSTFGIVQAIKYADYAYIPFSLAYNSIVALPTTNIDLTSAQWEDAEFPPYKFYNINPDTGYGFALVYDISFGYGIPEIRTGDINRAISINGASHKFYPNFYGKGTIVENGKVIAGNACRIPVKLVDNGILFYWHSGESLIIELEAFAAGKYSISIPDGYIGKNATVIKHSDTIPIDDFTISNNQLYFYANGSGSATILVS